MTAVFESCAISVSVSALLLAAALLAGAGADDVTTAGYEYEDAYAYRRVRQYPVDEHATILWMIAHNITDVNYDDLANLPNVERIMLNSNAIAHIEWRVFRSAPKLRELNFQENKLRELVVFGEHSCPSLTMLFLGSNLLEDISDPETFSACSRLTLLDLHRNLIQYIHPSCFGKLTKLTDLFLTYNKLTYIPQGMFARNSKLIQLELSDNRLTYLPSDFVVNLKRAGVNLRHFFFDNNPWQCGCLVELLVDVKRAGVLRHKTSQDDGVSYYEGGIPECVYAGAVPCCRQLGLLRRPTP